CDGGAAGSAGVADVDRRGGGARRTRGADAAMESRVKLVTVQACRRIPRRDTEQSSRVAHWGQRRPGGRIKALENATIGEYFTQGRHRKPRDAPRDQRC